MADSPDESNISGMTEPKAMENGRARLRFGFDFSEAMSQLCADIAERLDDFSHLRMNQVAVAFAQARRRVPHGLQAKLTPMRFEGGSLTTRRNGQTWTVQRLYHNNREMLYILTFYLPRFQNHSFREKMITVFHELFHISPQFNGDIRRLDGHYHVHSHSQKEYDRQMAGLADKYLYRNPPPSLLAFLRSRFPALESRFGRVIGLQVPVPKLVPLSDQQSA